jgi:hypothetical protein
MNKIGLLSSPSSPFAQPSPLRTGSVQIFLQAYMTAQRGKLERESQFKPAFQIPLCRLDGEN